MGSSDAEFYQAIVSNMAEGVCLVRGSDMAIVYANPRFEQLFGYEPGGLVGRPVPILNYAEDEQGALAVARAIIDELERQGEASYEIRNRKKDGTPFWCRARTSRFLHPEFGPVWLAVHTDISAEKAATERLRVHERLLNSVFDALPVGLWIADGEGRIVDANPAAVKIWGGARYVGIEQFGEYQAWRVDTGAPVAPEEWGIARAIHKGETDIGTLLRIRCFDGTYKTILNSVIPLRNDDRIAGAIAVNEDVTRLTEAEALAAGVIAAAPDALIALDGQRRIVVFNPGAERIFGYSREEVMGRHVDSLLPEAQIAGFARILDDVAAGGSSEPPPIACRRRSGVEFPGEVSAACTDGGLLQRYTLVIRDITARVAAEQERARLALALEHERTWLRSLIDTAPVGIVTVDAAGRVALNRCGEELLGVELHGRADGSPLRFEEMPVSRALHGESTGLEEFMLVRPDGSRRWALGGAMPVKAADGRQIGVIGTFQDITEQKLLEADLRLLAEAGKALAGSLDYEETLQRVARLVVPGLADGCVIHLLDEAGDVVPVAVHCDDTGRARAIEEVLRRYPARGESRGAGNVVRTGKPELASELSSKDLQEYVRDEMHRELLRSTGLRSYLTVPLRAREETIGAITLFDDGSGRRLLPRDVALVEILGQRAGLAIDNARLYRASRLATSTRDEVLAVVAHDIRNPLTAISMAIGTVIHALSPEMTAAWRSAEAIQRSASRISRLIRDLLDVARIDAGGLTLDREPVAVEAVVAEAVELVRPTAEEHVLEVTVPAGLPPVPADRHRILQVLANLLGNAVKFTPPGGRITVAVERRGGELEFSVRDNGPGIAPELVDHVFDRFWQVRRGDRRGAGLGLAIVKGIVESHGGKVQVENRPGLGAEFRFTLPLADTPPVDLVT